MYTKLVIFHFKKRIRVFPPLPGQPEESIVSKITRSIDLFIDTQPLVW